MDGQIPKSVVQNSRSGELENIYRAIPIDAIPLDTPLPSSIFLKIVGQFILFRPANDILTRARAMALEKKSVEALYIRVEEWEKFSTACDKVLEEKVRMDFKAAVGKLRGLLFSYNTELKSSARIDAKTISKCTQICTKLALGVANDPSLGERLLRRYKDPALFAGNHAINVAIYTASIANRLRMQMNERESLTLSAFFHDIGKTQIPSDIGYAQLRLTDEQYRIFQSHTVLGARILAAAGLTNKQLILVALQHHERMDGKGYPKQLKGEQIDLFARICSVADQYDDLISPSSRNPHPVAPRVAIEMMSHMYGKFDPQLFNIAQELRALSLPESAGLIT